MSSMTIARCLLLMLLVSSAACSETPEQPVDCLIDKGPCVKKTGRAEIIFDIAPKPVRAMRELYFTVIIKGEKKPATPLLRLSMPGMYMGKNEVPLSRSAEGIFKGTGIIARCPSGRKLWRAEVEMPGTGRVFYIFNVKY